MPKACMVRRTNWTPKKTNFKKRRTDGKTHAYSADPYERFVNESVSEKIAKLNRIGNADTTIPSKMDVFQSKTGKEHAVSPDSTDESESLITRLESEYEQLQEILLYQELMFQRTKDELEKKQGHIRKTKDGVRSAIQDNAGSV